MAQIQRSLNDEQTVIGVNLPIIEWTTVRTGYTASNRDSLHELTDAQLAQLNYENEAAAHSYGDY